MYGANEMIKILRDVEAVEIPSGRKMTLYKGTEVAITQSLGGTFTVVSHQGTMSSISGKDADALGKEASEVKTTGEDGTKKTTEQMVWDQMKTCYDPEIPHNIVDLGLIYKCEIMPAEGGDKKVEIVMTLTAPGCGMGDYIKQDVQTKVQSVPEVKECLVTVTFDPPWDRSRMSPALRREFM